MWVKSTILVTCIQTFKLSRCKQHSHVKKYLNKWAELDPIAHMLKGFCLHIAIHQFMAQNVQFWLDFIINYRMHRVDIKLLACEISKQSVNFKNFILEWRYSQMLQ